MMKLLMIPALLERDFEQATIKIIIMCVFFVLIIIATLIDLRTAITASKRRGSFKTRSYGLRKTGRKLLEYWALMLMASIVDFGLSAFGLVADSVYFFKIFSVPIVSIGVFVGIIITEALSVKENMEMSKGADIIPKKTYAVIAEIVEALGENSEDKLKAIAKLLKGNPKQQLPQNDEYVQDHLDG